MSEQLALVGVDADQVVFTSPAGAVWTTTMTVYDEFESHRVDAYKVVFADGSSTTYPTCAEAMRVWEAVSRHHMRELIQF